MMITEAVQGTADVNRPYSCA